MWPHLIRFPPDPVFSTNLAPLIGLLWVGAEPTWLVGAQTVPLKSGNTFTLGTFQSAWGFCYYTVKLTTNPSSTPGRFILGDALQTTFKENLDMGMPFQRPRSSFLPVLCH